MRAASGFALACGLALASLASPGLAQSDYPNRPILLTSGRHDEATPDQMARIVERLPQAEWVLFEESGHLSHAEEPDRYMAAVSDFMARAEAGQARRRGGAMPRPGTLAGPAGPRSAGQGRLTGRAGST